MSDSCRYFCYVYIFIIGYVFYKQSKARTIYLFSPLILIHFAFIKELFPALRVRNLPANIEYVLISTIIINILFVLIYNKQLIRSVNITLPPTLHLYNRKRGKLIFVFILILLATAIMTGIFQGILRGEDIENLRRVNEIGIGFIRNIPMIGLQVLCLIYLLLQKKGTFKKSVIICLFLGLFLFFITGHKAGFLVGMNVLFFYMAIKYRGFKWYEYLLIYLSIPLAAAFFQSIRGGNISLFTENLIIFWNYSDVMFHANTLPLMAYFSYDNFLYGAEYVFSLVTFIPRIIWEGKPISYDYQFKELLNYEFEGGGVPISTPYSLYINFGYYSWLFYGIWLFLIYSLYSVLLQKNISYYSKLIALFALTIGAGSIALTISQFEILLLFLILCRFYYGHSKIL